MGVRFPDIIGACLALVITLPFFLIIPVLIKLDSLGPVFYHQARAGCNRRRRERRVRNLQVEKERRSSPRRIQNAYGKPFVMYKFRTMVKDAERRSGPVWAMRDDPRITNIGHWLRKTHLDELPQLWNVLRGDMSLVGPRPERPEIISKIVREIPDYGQRLQTKPGLTGLAQICWGGDGSMDDVRKKLQFDLVYIARQTWRMRLRILFYTMIKAISPAATIDLDVIDPGMRAKAMVSNLEQVAQEQ
jgi:lipopolysaccharide/colanic/teichoic acid biosynthesis glycosyltransferase